MIGFAGKRILFIGIGFYDYEQCIVDRLRSRGADVDSFQALAPVFRNGMIATPLRMAGIEGGAFIRRHERDILRRTSQTSYDQVLIVKATELRPAFLEALRRRQGRAEFILYQWDSLARLPDIEKRLPLFDRILTFDRRDAQAHDNFAFRPLFYRDAPEPRSPGPDDSTVHLCFVGWLHSDRLGTLRRLQSMAVSQELSFEVYLYTGLRTFLRLILDRNARDVHVRALPYSQVLERYRRAAVIVDLPHARQSGLTMRAIETLGIGRKLLTTAQDVENYDFYSSSNIRVIHTDALELDRSFVREPAKPYAELVRRRYSLDAWIDDVFAGPRPAASSRSAAFSQSA